MSDRPDFLESAALSTIGSIRHGFFGRRGGVSTGRYDSLNCGYGSDDDREAVRENRRRVAAALDADAADIVTAYQIHGTDVVEVTEPWQTGARPRADAMIATRPNLPLGILSADCAPVLFADPAAGVIGACHAGWRGALAGVTSATVAAMAAKGARRDRIRAAIGPCIGQQSYEVGPEFPAPFLKQSRAHERFFRPAERDGHFLFDLPGYLETRLRDLGLAAVETAARDTYAEEESYFSYRRACHEDGGDYGRNVSVICMRA